MALTLTPKQLIAHLLIAIPAKIKTLIKGKPGICKSAVVEQVIAQLKWELVMSHPSVADPTDYKGMPGIVKGEAQFLPFGDMQKLIKAKVPTVCFIDDLGQAPHSVQAALMQPLHARCLNGHKISEHVVFVGATNDTSHRAGVNSILEPVKSRWDTIVELEANLDDWSTWAFGSGVPPEVIAFLRFRPDLLCKFEATRELTNSPNPRTWEALGKNVKAGLVSLPVLAGAVGEAAAGEFLGFLRVYKNLPTIDQILHDPQTAPVPTEPSALYAVTAALVRKFTKPNANRCFIYAARLPKERESVLIRDALRVCPELATTQEYTTWAIAQPEAA